ncbi:hypothetical protein JXA32_04560 [Candidatus Sumerlaeota bacterium]|nr:hypothetical protein [Candidatus Sumerlaeota bacterium]
MAAAILDAILLTPAYMIILFILMDGSFLNPDIGQLTFLYTIETIYIGLPLPRLYLALVRVCDPRLREDLALTLIRPDAAWHWQLRSPILRMWAGPLTLGLFLFTMSLLAWIVNINNPTILHNNYYGMPPRSDTAILLEQCFVYLALPFIIIGIFLNAIAGVYSTIATSCRRPKNNILIQLIIQGIFTFCILVLFIFPVYILGFILWLLLNDAGEDTMSLACMLLALCGQAWGLIYITSFVRKQPRPGWLWKPMLYWAVSCVYFGFVLEFLAFYSDKFSGLTMMLILVLPCPVIALLRLLERRQAAQKAYFNFET